MHGDSREIPTISSIFVPANLCSRRVFDHQGLLEVCARQAGEPRCQFAHRQKERWHVLGSPEAAAIKVVTPPIGDRSPFSEEAVELELLERELNEMGDQSLFFFGGNQIG